MKPRANTMMKIIETLISEHGSTPDPRPLRRFQRHRTPPERLMQAYQKDPEDAMIQISHESEPVEVADALSGNDREE